MLLRHKPDDHACHIVLRVVYLGGLDQSGARILRPSLLREGRRYLPVWQDIPHSIGAQKETITGGNSETEGVGIDFGASGTVLKIIVNDLRTRLPQFLRGAHADASPREDEVLTVDFAAMVRRVSDLHSV